ncbi:hypothetical protein [Methylobacterium sp. J-070]|uniref:hypothetical protein n=1 Tax=Methylobacterium sp. J-070 TaxID=2836650 RepID=UPI001FB89020|nr:hypothetical protein [Methylobacterium sp. J-070]MCJ2050663.1 hypothetical protein [Methylobacterium sp. J-070]
MDVGFAYARIASALGIPDGTFRLPDAILEAQVENLIEVADLLRDFELVKDKQARRRCLSYVNNTAERLDRRSSV